MKPEYCCLGVLCEVAIKSGLPVEKIDNNARSYDGHDSTLPRTVMEWSGVKDDLGRTRGYNALSSMNDDCTTFTQIADFIEAHVDAL